MPVDPVFNGLRRAAKLPSDLRDRATMNNNLFDGGALSGEIIAQRFGRHGRFRENKSVLKVETTKHLSTQKENS